MAPGMSMSLAFAARRGGRAVALFLLATLLWPPAGGADDWATGNYPDRHYENDLRLAGIERDTASLVKAVQGDPRESVRRWAAIILGRRHEETAREVLMTVAQHDGSAEVRTEALLALARLGDSSVLPALEQIMREGRSLGGPAVLAIYLADLGDASGYKYVEQETASPLAYRRALSVGSLMHFMPYRRQLGNDPFRRLVALTHDPDQSVREDAVGGLQWAWSRGVSLGEIRQAASWMLEQKEDPKLRELAVRTLTTIEQIQEDVDAGRIKGPPAP